MSSSGMFAELSTVMTEGRKLLTYDHDAVTLIILFSICLLIVQMDWESLIVAYISTGAYVLVLQNLWRAQAPIEKACPVDGNYCSWRQRGDQYVSKLHVSKLKQQSPAHTWMLAPVEANEKDLCAAGSCSPLVATHSPSLCLDVQSSPPPGLDSQGPVVSLSPKLEDDPRRCCTWVGDVPTDPVSCLVPSKPEVQPFQTEGVQQKPFALTRGTWEGDAASDPLSFLVKPEVPPFQSEVIPENLLPFHSELLAQPCQSEKPQPNLPSLQPEVEDSQSGLPNHAACEANGANDANGENKEPDTLASVGAGIHPSGCIPCKFLVSRSGCKDGNACVYCHAPHPDLNQGQRRRLMSRINRKKRMDECSATGLRKVA
eukprot:gnl/MRDRNA2_/MRDRNA2_115961_c0_seq1.p1 gnl/MRDRNA2_/MRDRNA2_115961_c0~~gnl/MRDRNA2_/MRDRNA2_115961_c0_seq1.p1  ORF type:complete len:392 (+),score=39.28 gnl/MRDRNA2_/MRDRNA2_115961_c0_seq1:63-1178(+)